MPTVLQAGLIIGFVAALPYLVLMCVGIYAALRGRGTHSLRSAAHLAGAACGALVGALLLAVLVFFLVSWTGLTRDPSVFWWSASLALPTLLAGGIGFLGTVRDEKNQRFDHLFIGILLAIVGFCVLPVGLVVFLAGMIFGSSSGQAP